MGSAHPGDRAALKGEALLLRCTEPSGTIRWASGRDKKVESPGAPDADGVAVVIMPRRDEGLDEGFVRWLQVNRAEVTLPASLVLNGHRIGQLLQYWRLHADSTYRVPTSRPLAYRDDA